MPDDSNKDSGLEDFLKDEEEVEEEAEEEREEKEDIEEEVLAEMPEEPEPTAEELPAEPPKAEVRPEVRAEKRSEDYLVDSGEPMKMATVVGGYGYSRPEGRDVMLELGHPAIVLLLAYLLTLPGIIMEFFMLKYLWYYGFELYSIYIFILTTGCVLTGIFFMFRQPGSNRILSVGDRKLFAAASVVTALSITLLVLSGNGAPEIVILISVVVVVSLIALMISSPRIERKEGFAIAAFGAGAIVAALVPVHQAFGIWGGGGGALGFTLFDGALLVIGVSISFIALNSMRQQTSLFASWIIGATMVALVAFHELASINASGSFEIYDQVLALEGAVFSVVPLSLYFLREVESARLWTHLINSTRYLEKKNYERALIEIEKTMELLSRMGYATKLSLPWSVYGDIYYAMGRMNRANTCYEMALQISPKNLEALLNMGNMHAVRGDGEQAISSYMKAAELAPDDPKPWNNIGVVYLSQHKLDHALAAFETAIGKDERFPMPYYNAATILQRSGKPAAAMELLDRLMDVAPADEDYRKAHERGKVILEHFQQAAGWKQLGIDVTDLVKTLIQDPETFDVLYNEFLRKMVLENAHSAFGKDGESASESLQSLLDYLGDQGEEVSWLERKTGMSHVKLKFGIASLILTGKARFSALNKEIVLVPIATVPEFDEFDKEEPSDVRSRSDIPRKVSSIS
jgi:tetratricopeptide (TPR) repeat protein